MNPPLVCPYSVYACHLLKSKGRWSFFKGEERCNIPVSFLVVDMNCGGFDKIHSVLRCLSVQCAFALHTEQNELPVLQSESSRIGKECVSGERKKTEKNTPCTAQNFHWESEGNFLKIYQNACNLHGFMSYFMQLKGGHCPCCLYDVCGLREKGGMNNILPFFTLKLWRT